MQIRPWASGGADYYYKKTGLVIYIDLFLFLVYFFIINYFYWII